MLNHLVEIKGLGIKVIRLSLAVDDAQSVQISAERMYIEEEKTRKSQVRAKPQVRSKVASQGESSKKGRK